MDSFNPYGRQQDPNHVPRSAVTAQQVHIGGGRYRQSSASTHLHSARPAAGSYTPALGAPTPTTGGYTANSRPAYTPAGNATATAAGTPITIPLAQPYPDSYSYTPMVMGSPVGIPSSVRCPTPRQAVYGRNTRRGFSLSEAAERLLFFLPAH